MATPLSETPTRANGPCPNLCETTEASPGDRERYCGCPDSAMGGTSAVDYCQKKPGHNGGHYCYDPSGGWPRRLSDRCTPQDWAPSGSTFIRPGACIFRARDGWRSNLVRGLWASPWAAMRSIDLSVWKTSQSARAEAEVGRDPDSAISTEGPEVDAPLEAAP
jgi:hypothetical protein